MNTEITKEEMSPEEFEQAQAGGMVFKSEKEAKLAAKKYEKQYLAAQESKRQECNELVALFVEHERQDMMASLSDEEKEIYIEKERRSKLPKNVIWRQMAYDILGQGAVKRKMKQKAERLIQESEDNRRKKIEDQLTMKPA